jgi:hypothetical protein
MTLSNCHTTEFIEIIGCAHHVKMMPLEVGLVSRTKDSFETSRVRIQECKDLILPQFSNNFLQTRHIFPPIKQKTVVSMKIS